jgi:hypothetical protein
MRADAAVVTVRTVSLTVVAMAVGWLVAGVDRNAALSITDAAAAVSSCAAMRPLSLHSPCYLRPGAGLCKA